MVNWDRSMLRIIEDNICSFNPIGRGVVGITWRNVGSVWLCLKDHLHLMTLQILVKMRDK